MTQRREQMWCRAALEVARELRAELVDGDGPLCPPGYQAVLLGRLIERLWEHGFEPGSQVIGSGDLPELRRLVRWAADRVFFRRPSDLERAKDRALSRWALAHLAEIEVE